MKTTSEIHENEIRLLYSKILNVKARDLSQSEVAFLAVLLNKVADLSVEIARRVPEFWAKQVDDDPLLWILLGILITEINRSGKSIDSKLEIINDDDQDPDRVAHA